MLKEALVSQLKFSDAMKRKSFEHQNVQQLKGVVKRQNGADGRWWMDTWQVSFCQRCKKRPADASVLKEVAAC